jgi:hypothetical protein
MRTTRNTQIQSVPHRKPIRYRAKLVNAVWGNSRCLLWEPCGTDTVCTSQETHYVSATETTQLMLFGKTVAVYCENHTEHTDALFEHNIGFGMIAQVVPLCFWRVNRANASRLGLSARYITGNSSCRFVVTTFSTNTEHTLSFHNPILVDVSVKLTVFGFASVFRCVLIRQPVSYGLLAVASTQTDETSTCTWSAFSSRGTHPY